MNLPYVSWVYEIALLALIKLSWLQHMWLFDICGIHLCTFWRGVGVFTKGFVYYQQWYLHWKFSFIRYRLSFAFNFLIFSLGFLMPEAWFWEWEGANIYVTELSYGKETFLCPNQTIFLNKLTCSENNNSVVYSRFRPTNQHIKPSNRGLDKQDALNVYPLCGLPSVAFTETQNQREVRECVCYNNL